MDIYIILYVQWISERIKYYIWYVLFDKVMLMHICIDFKYSLKAPMVISCSKLNFFYSRIGEGLCLNSQTGLTRSSSLCVLDVLRWKCCSQ